MAAQYNIPHVYTDFRQLLQRDDIEAVDVCLHNNFHSPVTIAALQAEPPVEAAHETARKGLESVDASTAMLFDLRARVGGLLNRADAIESRLADLKLQAQTERSLAEDIDLIEALSSFQSRQTSYDAALKTYTMVQRMSLFDYLGS